MFGAGITMHELMGILGLTGSSLKTANMINRKLDWKMLRAQLKLSLKDKTPEVPLQDQKYWGGNDAESLKTNIEKWDGPVLAPELLERYQAAA